MPIITEIFQLANHILNCQKAASGYLEIEHFKHADLHTGYFCYNCTYFIKDTHCAIVHDSGPDVNGTKSEIIAPYGVWTLWHPNEGEVR